MQHLTIKNLVLSFLALNLFSAVALHSQLKTVGSVSAPHEAARPAKAKPATPDLRHRQPDIVKVLDLPDNETLRFNETTFVDLGWRQTDQNGGEWVGHIGSDTEYIPLNAEQITGMLKEAQLKSLPPPPAPRVDAPRTGPKEAPPPPEAINLLSYIPMLLGIFVMLYIRYRIIQATLDAAQSATGLVQRALSDLFSSRTKATQAQPAATGVVASRAPAPATTNGHFQTRTKRSNTVVRPAAGLFGMWSRAR